MKINYIEIEAKSEDSGITEEQKNEFFKLYQIISKRAKKFVGMKKNSKLIQSNWETMLKAMRELSEL
jgi:hypothetical protein